MNDDQLAPIGFFAFNRPEHTLRSLEAIQASPLADRSLLYIYCDGPRPHESPEGVAVIQEVRHIAAREQWCGKVVLRLRDCNLGCARSLLGGISEVLDRHDRLIVIEDDVVVAPGFLRYMNEGLQLYKGDSQVMHIAAYGWLQRTPDSYPHSTMFLNHTTVGWGWATWKRAWDKLSTDGRYLRRRIDELGIKRYVNLNFGHDFYWALKYLDEGSSQDWNCYWHASVAIQGGYCLHPVTSLADNIGFDGSGTHSRPRDRNLLRKTGDSIELCRIPIEELPELRRRMTNYPLRRKIVMRFKHLARMLYFDVLKIERRFWI